MTTRHTQSGSSPVSILNAVKISTPKLHLNYFRKSEAEWRLINSTDDPSASCEVNLKCSALTKDCRSLHLMTGEQLKEKSNILVRRWAAGIVLARWNDLLIGVLMMMVV